VALQGNHPLLTLPCPAAWRGGTKQNIGETVRSNGEAETTIEQICLTPPPAVSRSMAGSFGATRRVPTKKRGSPQRLIEVSLLILSPCVPARNIGGVPAGRGG